MPTSSDDDTALSRPPDVLPATAATDRPPERALTHWVAQYMGACIEGANINTAAAKRRDLRRFVAWFLPVLGDAVDAWAPPVSKAFQAWLVASRPEGAGLAASSANRTLATARHFGKWLHGRRPFACGEPCAAVRDIVLDKPQWRGLDETARLRLASALSSRLKSCTRKDQNPLLEAAVYYVLLHTGLRVGELVALQLEQYDGKRLQNVWLLCRYRHNRHTFLKRYVEKYGVVAAQAASGNVSTAEIFRYAAPSEAELEQQAAELF